MKQIRKYGWIRILLYPFALAYAGITGLRNYFFDQRIFDIARFNRPLISIGNITAGGTGKTPFTLLCLELLKQRYAHMVVVSRGYGRKTKGLIIVSDGQSSILSAVEGGDEPVMIAKKFPDIPVIVAEKRADGIKKAIDQFNPEVILLDDAFQHRRVERSCDIVLINGSRSLEKEHLLPLGDLRERIKNLKRADIVIINETHGRLSDKDVSRLNSVFKGPVFSCHFEPFMLINSDWQIVGPLQSLQNEQILAFTAIADPGQFQAMLTANGLKINRLLSYPDHFAYDAKSFQEISAIAKKTGCTAIITTEKDLVKIDADYFSGFQLLALRLQGRLENAESFLNKLIHFIDNKI